MSANWNARRMLRWTTLAGLLAATVALGATPAAADNDRHRHRHHHGNQWGNYGGGYGYGGYGYYRPRHNYRPYYYAPSYYYPPPPPAYYYPQPYYGPSFSFGLTVPIR